MANEYLIGIDMGTSGCKLALFDLDGVLVFQGTKPYPTHYPHPGYAEQDPEDWWRAVCDNLTELFSTTGIDPNDIKGIGVDGQSGAMIPMDETGRPLRKAMIWLDRRSAPQCEEMVQKAGKKELFAISGNPVSPSYVTGKILWMKEHEPGHYSKTRKIVQCNSYIVYRLTGLYSQDTSQGNGLHMFNIKTAQWDYALSERLNIPTEWLPEIFDCSDVVGEVSGTVSSLTGLAAGTPVVAGGLDAACATLGAGALHPGDVQEQGGQAGGMSIVMDEPIHHERLILSCHVVKDRWILQGGTVGGGSLNWMKREFSNEEENFFDKATKAAAQIRPGSEGLIFLPYMAGERSPIWDVDAKGVFMGLSYEKTRGHLYRAVMEGCGFALHHNLSTALESGAFIDVLYSVGGAANSVEWTQIKADITGRRIKIPSSDAATALGAAILAGVGTGLYASYAEAIRRTLRVQREHQPNVAHQQIYNQVYEVYKELYDRLKDLFPKMGW